MAHDRQSVRWWSPWRLHILVLYYTLLCCPCNDHPMLPSFNHVISLWNPLLVLFHAPIEKYDSIKFDQAFPWISRFPLLALLQRLTESSSSSISFSTVTTWYCIVASLPCFWSCTPILSDLRDVDINSDVVPKFQANWSIYIAPAFVVKLMRLPIWKIHAQTLRRLGASTSPDHRPGSHFG